MLPDQHDAIMCISSVSQFNIMEANKVKELVILNKTHQPFSFMSPPNSIALGLGSEFSWLFLIHYKLSENQPTFSLFRNKVSIYIQKPRTIWVIVKHFEKQFYLYILGDNQLMLLSGRKHGRFSTQTRW